MCYFIEWFVRAMRPVFLASPARPPAVESEEANRRRRKASPGNTGYSQSVERMVSDEGACAFCDTGTIKSEHTDLTCVGQLLLSICFTRVFFVTGKFIDIAGGQQMCESGHHAQRYTTTDGTHAFSTAHGVHTPKNTNESMCRGSTPVYVNNNFKCCFNNGC